MIYLFDSEKVLKFFYEKKYYKEIANINNLIKFLIFFINKLIEYYDSLFKKRVLLIIDNLDINNIDDEEDSINELIELILNNPKKFKIIISGINKYLKNKFVLFLKKEISMNIGEKREAFLYYYLKKEKKDEDKDKEERIILIEEINYCPRFNLYGMCYSLINDGIELSIQDIIQVIDLLPLEYLNFKLVDNNNNNNDKIIFSINNTIFRKAMQNKIRNIIKMKNIQFFIEELNYRENRLKFGIFEEKLMVLFFESNRLGLNNLIFEEENIFEINEIYQLKYSAYKTTKQKFKSNSPILITQKYYKDENYDFLILIPLITSYKKIVYMSFFIQTGTNKNQEIIDKIKI